MFDDFSKRSKAVKAALDLAKERSWSDIALTDIAREAGLSLAELRREFACKTDILRAFQAELDAAVLAKTRPAGETSTPRDRLFDVVMSRFEAMQPYKPALKRIATRLCCRPGEAAVLLGSSLQSQYWMLEAAGAKLDGPGGRASRRRPRRYLRQSVLRVARRRHALARQDHGRARPASRQRRTHAVGHGDGLRRSLPLRLRAHAARVEAREGEGGDRARRGAGPCAECLSRYQADAGLLG